MFFSSFDFLFCAEVLSGSVQESNKVNRGRMNSVFFMLATTANAMPIEY